jgi:predicted ATPase with chaperone activity
MDELLMFLRQEQAVEIVGSSGIGEQAYQFALTGRGVEKAEEAIQRNHYIGPAPVPFEKYVEVLMAQTSDGIHVTRELFLDNLSDLVLGRQVLAALGPAVSSGRSVLIHGKSGNGKTSVAMSIGRMLPGQTLIPHAVEVDGQIIKVFDPRMHQAIQQDPLEERRQSVAGTDGAERRLDRRWQLAKRPVVAVGGELTLQDLELHYSTASKFYIAPLQWKANGGALIIDDFGRQMVQPQELLNRWIVPMEQGVDHLSLHSGDTVELPFRVLLIFSTNIPPKHLGDEAFFRRIRHKVEVPNPSLDDFLEILRKVCAQRGIAYSDEGAKYLVEQYYNQTGRDLRGCHPRDLVDLMEDITRFYGEAPALTPEWIDLASASYFVDTDDLAA